MTFRIGVNTAADRELMSEVENWIARKVDCVLGRREFSQGRYCVALVADRAEFRLANARFSQLLRQGLVSACYYVCRAPYKVAALESSAKAIEHLQKIVLPGEYSEQGAGNAAQSFQLVCPVTRLPTVFPDFDFVAFYPQANLENDSLYDPSNAMPFAGINEASDLYGFACFVRDLADRQGVAEIGVHPDRDALFQKAKRMWQGMAVRTFENIGARTNPALVCPVHVTDDERYYVTPHDESAFAEFSKRVHRSEMPVVYLDRLIAGWERAFTTGNAPCLHGVVRPAEPLALTRFQESAGRAEASHLLN